MSQFRVLLADDHELFRQGIAAQINSQPDMTVAGQAEDGFEAIVLARDLQPDLIVMDINMPICDGLEAVRLIRKESSTSEVRIVMLTVYEEDEQLFEAIKAGANGYFLKDVAPTEFFQGLRRVLAGEAVVPPKLAARLLEEFARLAGQTQPTSDTHDEPDLTPREEEVLTFIAEGATDREIAIQLSVSLHTVKSHVRNILSKLHVVNRRHAAKMARQLGLIDSDRQSGLSNG